MRGFLVRVVFRVCSWLNCFCPLKRAWGVGHRNPTVNGRGYAGKMAKPKEVSRKDREVGKAASLSISEYYDVQYNQTTR